MSLNFGDFNERNCYCVVINGNEVVKFDCNYKPCLRKALSLSRNKNILVELWYVHNNGSMNCVKFWN